MNARAWNHSIHYHDLVLRAIPAGCARALDVGCGRGLLARELAGRCGEVVAIDLDHDALENARLENVAEPRITFVEGDVLTHPLADGSFDLITVLASLHHLPLELALARFRDLLKPGGVLVVIGLYREHTLADYAWAAVGVLVSRMYRCIYRWTEVGAPLAAPKETLAEIRAACRAMLPGAIVRRRLLFRYSLVWRKP